MKRFLLERYIPLDNKNHDWPQVYSTVVACFAGFTCSVLLAWPSPTIPIIMSNSSHIPNVTLEETSYFTVIPPLVNIAVVPLVILLLDKMGRKSIMFLLNIPQIFTWLLIVFGNNLTMLYASRILFGISNSGLFVIAMYVGEITTPKVRGFWGNLLIIFLFSGILFVNAVGSYTDIKTAALIFLALPIVHGVFIAIIPESPYYLMMKNRKLEAEDSLKWLRWNTNVQDELTSIGASIERQISQSSKFKDLWIIPSNRKALLVMLILFTGQQLSGFSSFIVYTQYIFSISEGNISASLSAIVITFIMLVVSVVSCFTVDKFGRRPLLIFSTAGTTLTLFVEALYFYLLLKTDVNVTSFNWIPLFGLIVYSIVNTPGLGLMPTLMMSEIFAVGVKSKAVGIAHLFYTIFVLSVPKLFQFLSDRFGMDIPFFLFGICTMCSIVFCYLFVPETRLKTLEEIQQMLMKKVIKNRT